jgi:hypothetical protein
MAQARFNAVRRIRAVTSGQIAKTPYFLLLVGNIQFFTIPNGHLNAAIPAA